MQMDDEEGGVPQQDEDFQVPTRNIKKEFY